LENTRPADWRAMASANVLQTLTLAHGAYDVANLDALPALRTLHLRALDIPELPPLHRLVNVERLVLRELRNLKDLSPIARARSLRELEIAGMPHLNVGDFAPLAGRADLRDVSIDLASRRKEREIYRLMRIGNT
jgi:hypothetical protein